MRAHSSFCDRSGSPAWGLTGAGAVCAQAYREVRGAIMQAYRRVPERPLTCGDAVAAAGASAEAAPRVWAFLDSWGLINHLVLDHHSADADTADQSGVPVLHVDCNPKEQTSTPTFC